MYQTLKALYDSFYRPQTMEKLEQEISNAHRQLISNLEKSDRRLVLQIIDAKDSIINASSLDGFICGFHLAMSLINEASFYKNGKDSSARVSHPVFQEENDLQAP